MPMIRLRRLSPESIMPVLLPVLGVILAALPAPASAAPADSTRIGSLRCEYLADPLGIDMEQPRLSWIVTSAERGQHQTAYQVLVATSPERLAPGRADLWDSGRVYSGQSVAVPFGGKPLPSRASCHWKVRIWDRSGRASSWSPTAFWGMGLLREGDWRGKWIASDLQLMDYQKKLRDLPDWDMLPEKELRNRIPEIRKMTAGIEDAPAVWMRREFEVPGGVRRATAYVCGLGFHELYLNGKRVSDHYLDPAPTDYEKRALYLAHDVTGLLRQGRNAVGSILGNGWYNLITPHLLNFYAADYISPPRLRFDLEIELSDGTRRFIGTDGDWKFTLDGPIRFNCVLGGETYDARKEMPGWDRPGFDDSKWKPALLSAGPGGRLVSQKHPAVRRIQAIAAIGVAKHEDGYRFDLGVETVGWAQLRVRGKAGQEITIRYPGVDSHSLGRYQTCKYILAGSGVETYAPRFSYNGFRYVDVSGLDYEPTAGDLTGQMVCTDLQPAGEFACSDERLMKIQEILLRTIRNYIVHIPNDPTREKAGWTQDIESGFFQTVYNFHASAIYLKWQRDFLDLIHPNGYVPPVAPSRFDGPDLNGPWWGGVIIYAPWYIYQFYGDREILAESYPAMRKQLEYLGSLAENHILRWGLGDWLEVGAIRPKRTPVALTSTCAYYYFSRILSQTAGILGLPVDAQEYAQQAGRIRTAFNREFLDPETGQYATGSQTCQLLPLHFDLAPENKREIVLRRFLERIAADGDHLSTGFVGTPLLLTGLTELGHPELAWKIATQPTYPSFIDAVLNRGNTVMKENWQGGLVQMPSLQGPIGTWFFHSLAGIRMDPSGPGFKRIIIRPELVGDLTWARAHHDSPYGRISAGWQRKGDRITLSVAIPVNTTATVHIPSSSASAVRESGKPALASPDVTLLRQDGRTVVFSIRSGTYNFESTISGAGD